jgi:hypothetical protein
MSSLYSGRHGISLRRLASILSVALILPALAMIAGCPTPGPTDQVSGTCKVGDENVGGTVIFVGDGGKKFPGPILAGKYKVDNAPKGKYKVYFEYLGGAPAGAADSSKKVETKDTGKVEMKEGPGMGVAPPAKYLSVDTSGLEIDVTGGKQTYDFKLTK